jgi:sugar phosphate isomerase/epimerase
VTHTAPDSILGDTEGVIAKHDILDCKYVGLGAMPKNYRKHEAVEDFHKNFHRAIKQIADSGKVFTYHNHAFEFEKKDGVFMLDKLFSMFDKSLMLTLDCYWANYGGVDVCELIEKYAGRIDCVHLKDYAIKNNEIIMAPVMRGNMNYPKIITALEKAGTKYALVEQDDCYGEDPFDCLAESYNNLKKYF